MTEENQKELKQIADQLEEQAANDLTLANKIRNISEFSTKELTNELANREGVEEIRIEPYDTVLVGGTEIEGPARILINTD